MMPWTLKFLWSPFLEMYQHEEVLSWLLTQMVDRIAGLALVALALQLPITFLPLCIATAGSDCFQRSHARYSLRMACIWRNCHLPDQAKYIGCAGGFLQHRQDWWRTAGLVWRWRVPCWPRVSVAMEGRSMQENMSAYKATQRGWIIFDADHCRCCCCCLGGYHSRACCRARRSCRIRTPSVRARR